MIIEETFIPGLKIIHTDEFKDKRGFLLKVFSEEMFKENHLDTDFRESYYSLSNKNVIRGMHFQVPPAEHTKVIYVNKGSILDVVLDIRKDSPCYGRYMKIDLTEGRPELIYIPKGCAHGFLSLEDDTMVTYLQTSCYSHENDLGIKFDSFGMDWGVSDPVVSERDRSFVKLDDFITPFML